jgi:glycosyltransferase involved in cell wall biosynthesis
VTKDRREDAVRAVGSAVAQRPTVEVLLVDDGSSDARAEAVAAAYPEVRVQRYEDSKGSIVRRNQAAEPAPSPIIVSIDDDADLPTEDIVATTVAEFDEPKVGAVAMPYRDLPDPTIHQRAPAEGVYLIHRFRGTAHAVRRELFLRLGSYRRMLFHQAEEADFCLLDAGYVVRLGRSEPVNHHVSPKRAAGRAAGRIWFYECRNDILFTGHNAPLPDLLPQVGRTTLHMLWLGRGARRTGLLARGLLAGAREAMRDFSGRRPVGRPASRLYRRHGKGPTQLDEIAALLPEAS